MNSRRSRATFAPWRIKSEHELQKLSGVGMSDTFLTQKEVDELTGIKRRRGLISKGKLQVAWLASKGFPAYLNEVDRAMVARAALLDRRAPLAAPEWVPNVLR